LLNARGVEEVVADKGYHRGAVLVGLHGESVRSYIPEPERGRRKWAGKAVEQQRVYANRRRTVGRRGADLQKLRSELAERSFAHKYETGGMRRVHLRGRDNTLTRLLIQGVGFNLGLLVREKYGKGKPRGLGRGFDAILGCNIVLAVVNVDWREELGAQELAAV